MADVPPDPWDIPGGLNIRQPRRWRTGYVVLAASVALLAGMALGHRSHQSSPPAPFALPVPAGATTTTEVASSGGGASVVLLPRVSSQGTGATPSFNPAGSLWELSWAFDCSAAPGGSGTLSVGLAGTGSAALVTQTGPAGSGSQFEEPIGPAALRITAPPACRWAVRATKP